MLSAKGDMQKRLQGAIPRDPSMYFQSTSARAGVRKIKPARANGGEAGKSDLGRIGALEAFLSVTLS